MTIAPETVQERFQLPMSARGPIMDQSGGLTFADVLGMLRRRTVLLAFLLIFFLALSTGGLVVWWVYFPGYRSECLVECVTNIPASGLTVEQERLHQEEHERFVATQAVLIKQPTVLSEALRLAAVRETPWFQSLAQARKDHLDELTTELVAAPARGTNFLRVSLETRNRTDPAIIVDAVVRVWLDMVRRRSADEFARELDDRRSELSNLETQIQNLRRQLQAIAVRLPPGARQDPADNSIAHEVRQLTEQVALLKLELSQIEQLRDIYNDPAGAALSTEDRSVVEQDPAIAEMRRQLFILEQQRAADATRYGNEHAVLRQMDSQLAATQEKLSQLESERLVEARENNREAADTAYANTQYALLLAQERLERAEAALRDQDLALFEYATIESQIEKATEDRNQLSDYVSTLERIVRQRSAIQVSIAQPATDPLRRSSPSLLMIPLFVFLSIALSTGTVLGLEMLDTSIRTPRDVLRHLDLPILGVIPDTDDEEIDIKQVETAIHDEPKSMVAEAFRRVRTNLQFSAPLSQQRAVMVTSPRPSDGATTVACNLAMAIAQAGRRVLLVDANFRRPGLKQLFSQPPSQSQPQTQESAAGLSNLLIGNANLDQCVVKTNVDGLDLLAAGRTPPNPAELLGGQTCRAFVEEAVSKYDQVIIDTSPVLIATDAVALGVVVDGTVLVIRAKHNSRGIARRAVALMQDIGVHLFGAVLNAAQITRGGYFREQLRSYYEYVGESEEDARST